MRNVFVLFALVVVLPLVLFAQVTADPNQVISSTDAIQQLLALFTSGGLKGLGIAAALIQAFMLLLRTDFIVAKFGQASGGIRLLVVVFLSVVGGLVQMVMQGMSWQAAAVSAASLAAYQVFFHQAYSYWISSKTPAAPAKAA